MILKIRNGYREKDQIQKDPRKFQTGIQTDPGPGKELEDCPWRSSALNNGAAETVTRGVPEQTHKESKDVSQRDIKYGFCLMDWIINWHTEDLQIFKAIVPVWTER